jgi:hypothetical protein
LEAKLGEGEKSAGGLELEDFRAAASLGRRRWDWSSIGEGFGW